MPRKRNLARWSPGVLIIVAAAMFFALGTAGEKSEDLGELPVITVVLEETYAPDGLVQDWSCRVLADPGVRAGTRVAVSLVNQSQREVDISLEDLNEPQPVMSRSLPPYGQEAVGYTFAEPTTVQGTCGPEPVPVVAYSGTQPVLSESAGAVEPCCETFAVP